MEDKAINTDEIVYTTSATNTIEYATKSTMTDPTILTRKDMNIHKTGSPQRTKTSPVKRHTVPGAKVSKLSTAEYLTTKESASTEKNKSKLKPSYSSTSTEEESRLPESRSGQKEHRSVPSTSGTKMQRQKKSPAKSSLEKSLPSRTPSSVGKRTLKGKSPLSSQSVSLVSTEEEVCVHESGTYTRKADNKPSPSAGQEQKTKSLSDRKSSVSPRVEKSPNPSTAAGSAMSRDSSAGKRLLKGKPSTIPQSNLSSQKPQSPKKSSLSTSSKTPKKTPKLGGKFTPDTKSVRTSCHGSPQAHSSGVTVEHITTLLTRAKIDSSPTITPLSLDGELKELEEAASSPRSPEEKLEEK